MGHQTIFLNASFYLYLLNFYEVNDQWQYLIFGLKKTQKISSKNSLTTMQFLLLVL